MPFYAIFWPKAKLICATILIKIPNEQARTKHPNTKDIGIIFKHKFVIIFFVFCLGLHTVPGSSTHRQISFSHRDGQLFAHFFATFSAQHDNSYCFSMGSQSQPLVIS